MSNKKSYRKYAVTTMAAAAAVASVAPVATAAEETDFSDAADISPDHIDAVNALVEQGVIAGYPDETFKPYEEVQRIQVAKTLVRVFGLEVPDNANEVLAGFSDIDVDKLKQDDLDAIAAVADAGYIEGDDGKFKANVSTSREQMASMIVRAFELDKYDTDDVEDVEIDFDKVSKDHRDAVQTIVNLGLSKEAPNFRAWENVDRQQYASFLYRTSDFVEKQEEAEQSDVDSVNPIDATSTEVTLKEATDGLTKDNFKLEVNGEEVSVTGVSANNDNTVYTLTHNSLQGQSGTLSVNGVEADFDYAEEATEIEIKSAEARSNTEVTVVLADAPLKNLKASDFNISPNLAISSVTTNDNVVTLKTAPQTEGTSYTITPTEGSGTATFTGIGEVDTTGVIDTVSVENLRQLKVTFDRPVLWSSLADLGTASGVEGTPKWEKFYLDMVTEEDGDVQTHSLENMDDEDEWLVSADGQDITDYANATVDYIIIESDKGHKLTDITISNTDQELKLNKSNKLDIRNAKDEDKKYVNTSQGGFTVADAEAPEVEAVNATAEIGRLYKEETGTYLDRTIADDEAYLVVEFDEPVQDKDDNAGFKFYVNGVEVDSDNVEMVSPQGTGDYVGTKGSVKEHATVILKVTDLPKDTQHTLEVVGAKDLNKNVQTPNPYTKTFTVIDEVREQQQFEIAEVVEINQTSDNVLDIIFDQPDVIAFTSAEDSVVLHDAVWDGTEWIDLEVKEADITQANTLDGKQTIWTVPFDAVNEKAGASDEFNYDGQNIVVRDVTVKNYIVAGASDPFYKGYDTRETKVFKKDQAAPKLAATTALEGTSELNVRFTDSPYGAPIAVANDKDIKVSMTDKDGVTEEITFTADSASFAGNGGLGYSQSPFAHARDTVTIDLDELSATDLLNGNDELIDGAVYTVTFEQGSIVDTASDLAWDSIIGDVYTNEDFDDYSAANRLILDGPNESTAIDASVTVGELTVGQGIVPQTTEGLIQSGVDITDEYPDTPTGDITDYPKATATTEFGDASTPGTAEWFNEDKNINKILVTFDGEVLESSAVNKNNYTFNGQKLPQDAKVTYYEDNINENVSIGGATDEINGYAIVELPEGTITRDGTYNFSVQGVTNKTGQRMLPVTTSVQLVDNTKPSIVNARAIGDKQVEVRFDEKVTITDAKAKGNFTVTIDGQKISVATVTTIADETRLVLTLADTFDVDGDIVVETHKDSNGNVYVTDQATPANDMREMTK